MQGEKKLRISRRERKGGREGKKAPRKGRKSTIPRPFLRHTDSEGKREVFVVDRKREGGFVARPRERKQEKNSKFSTPGRISLFDTIIYSPLSGWRRKKGP